MAHFYEFTALCKEEKSKEELQLEKTLNGEIEDIYLPGHERFRITIDMSSIVSFNESDKDVKNDCTVVGLMSGDRYKIDMRHDEFKKLMLTNKTRISGANLGAGILNNGQRLLSQIKSLLGVGQ